MGMRPNMAYITSSFIISKFNDFCDLAGNCLFMPCLERFLRDLSPQMGSVINGTPKRHILAQNDAIWRIKRQTRCSGRKNPQTKKNEKKRKKKPSKNNFTYTWVKNSLTDRNEILHNDRAPWYGGVIFQVFPLTLVVVLTTLWHGSARLWLLLLLLLLLSVLLLSVIIIINY